jgi:hypothetical protein
MFTEISNPTHGSEVLEDINNNSKTFNSSNTLHSTTESVNELLKLTRNNSDAMSNNLAAQADNDNASSILSNVGSPEENISNSTTLLRGYHSRMGLFKPDVSREDAEKLMEEVFSSF